MGISFETLEIWLTTCTIYLLGMTLGSIAGAIGYLFFSFISAWLCGDVTTCRINLLMSGIMAYVFIKLSTYEVRFLKGYVPITCSMMQAITLGYTLVMWQLPRLF